jgi:hypothetical protein
MNNRSVSKWAMVLLLLGALVPVVSAQRRGRRDDREWREREDRRRDWQELGCQTVSFRVDHDTVHVGRREGRFKAIRVVARGGDVEMLDLRVVYSNGAPDDIPVRQLLRRGDHTRPLDLRGARRALDRIDMVYRSLPNYRGRDAVVCVEGLIAD